MRFRELLAEFKGQRALVVGDVMLDEYIFGKATRISPEAPVMVVRQQKTNYMPGGAANVALNLIALGAEVSMVGVLGDDPGGATLEETLRVKGITTTGMISEASRATTRKTRVLADHAHQVLRIDHEDESPVSGATEQRLLDAAMGQLTGAQVLVMSDYLKGAVTDRLCRELIGQANRLGIPVIANPKPRSLGQFAGATVVSLNRLEASDAVGAWKGLKTEDALKAATDLRDRTQVKGILITLGEDGMAFQGEEGVLAPAPRVEVYDTAGAGDTVIATVALGVSVAGFAEDVFHLATHTAASVVRRVGVATPSAADLQAIAEVGERYTARSAHEN